MSASGGTLADTSVRTGAVARVLDVSSPPEEDIRRTIARYSMLCDDGRFDEWVDLFTPDATFHVMGATQEGRDAIKAFVSAGQTAELRGRHVTSNVLIDVDSWNGTARAWVDLVFVDQEGRITTVGRYHDVLERGGDKVWRFTMREIVFRGAEPQLTQPPPA